MASLHHLEFLVRNGRSFVQRIATQYAFQLDGFRRTASASQWLIRAGEASFLITEPKVEESGGLGSRPVLLQRRNHVDKEIDTVFDIALGVKNIDQILQNAESVGAEILQQTTRTEDEHGFCDMAVIKSCVGNVVHTLINRSGYRGSFLPGFDMECDLKVPASGTSFVDSVDHVTVVCRQGEVDDVLSWYEKVFGFTRFFMNRSESADDGFVLDGKIGLRLKAMEYFYCSETGLRSGETDGNAFKLVIAESLPGHDASTNQIEAFLKYHGGPGVQHVGFHTSNIVTAADYCRRMGVELQVPPAMYYHHFGKLDEIRMSGEDLESLRQHGILLDCEADASMNQEHKTYLKQVFTKPIFDKPTFFLELIERQGARGFGTGNIAALWWSAQQSLLSNPLPLLACNNPSTESLLLAQSFCDPPTVSP